MLQEKVEELRKKNWPSFIKKCKSSQIGLNDSIQLYDCNKMQIILTKYIILEWKMSGEFK